MGDSPPVNYLFVVAFEISGGSLHSDATCEVAQTSKYNIGLQNWAANISLRYI